MISLFIIPAFIGAGIASQTAINSYLKKITRSPFLSSTISFFVGAVFLIILLFLLKQPLSISPKLIQSIPWWAWIGGGTAAFSLTMNVILFPILGSMQTSVLPIAGQLIMGVMIDQFGLFSSPKSPLTLSKGLGLLILVLGMLLTTEVTRFINDKDNLVAPESASKAKIIWKCLGWFSGMLLAIQSATNGYLGKVLDSPIRSSVVSFMVAFSIMLFLSILLKTDFSFGLKSVVREIKQSWWLFAGGILGSTYVCLSAWLVPILGTGRVIVISLFGQLFFSVLIQQFGLFHSEVKKIKNSQMIGLFLMLIGIVTIQFF